ncbi:MAG: endonuclease domain-containing protein [Bacteroidetes bacterium]|nr:endonuclease domain-containing protein [Bacteroidota bacterium]MBK8846471.1 endonuclease domain-containing protein [Bacteroidota bacterium]MBL0050690.1 endonuclease domain-containing protein [Bacteroidota bacterium]
MNNEHFENLHSTAKPIQFVFAAQMRKEPTKAESILWSYLSDKQMQGLKFRRQHPLGNFILDFYCHQIKLSIELDGEIHQDEKQKEYDCERTKFLIEKGIFEIRFTNDIILDRITDALNEIENTIQQLKKKLK